MRLIDNIAEMRGWSERQQSRRERIVFVPTMGYLHEGHLSLAREGKRRGGSLVASIFVNPTQFAPHEDFTAYPRDFERDRSLLEKEGVDVLFHPSAEEMYPGGYQTRVDVEKLGSFLCGASRPGHFRGVCTVVAKLFHIVQPHVAVFGAKDYQQLQIVRRMAADLNFDIEIVGHPIVREPDGLALSSRNSYLSAKERQAALSLSRSLRVAEALVRRGEKRRGPITDAARMEIEREPLVRLEYVSLCDPITLEEVEEISDAAVLAVAAGIGKARLIDNAMLRA